jgi:RNA polymerase sigma-70 factor (ECF subfamily)
MSSTEALPTSEAVMRNFRKGDQGSFTVLFNHYYPQLCLFANHILQDRPEAEDIATETMLKLWERRKNFKSISNVKAFIFITARNACINLIKGQQIADKHINKWNYLLASETEMAHINNIIQTEVIKEMETVINSLPAACRKVLMMTWKEGKNPREIASALGISVHTIKNHKSNGLNLVRKHFSFSGRSGQGIRHSTTSLEFSPIQGSEEIPEPNYPAISA